MIHCASIGIAFFIYIYSFLGNYVAAKKWQTKEYKQVFHNEDFRLLPKLQNFCGRVDPFNINRKYEVETICTNIFAVIKINLPKTNNYEI